MPRVLDVTLLTAFTWQNELQTVVQFCHCTGFCQQCDRESSPREQELIIKVEDFYHDTNVISNVQAYKHCVQVTRRVRYALSLLHSYEELIKMQNVFKLVKV